MRQLHQRAGDCLMREQSTRRLTTGGATARAVR